MHRSLALIFCLLIVASLPGDALGFAGELRLRGYALFPAPQSVELLEGDITVSSHWRVQTAPRTGPDASAHLLDGARRLHGLIFSGGGESEIRLEVNEGNVVSADDPALSAQAYRIEIEAGLVRVTGNSQQGLFYGVQSLLQLLRRNPDGTFRLPRGTITDWPSLELRFIHWNTQCHQKRIPAMKRIIDWLAYFKVNCIAFELMDRFEFPRHPVIGAPGAYTKDEMQELTRYALKRHIQLVPVVQAPAHMRFVLKHPEFAHLRADGNNYQACMCNEEAMQLILDMYQDMIDATPGVKYFFASTDEVYYAGICGQCDTPYNIQNRSKMWVDFVNRINAWMNERGRRVLSWVEYPLLTEDIPLLPGNLIDAIMVPGRSQQWIDNENKTGIRQLVYSSMQGTEFLFPNYFPTVYRGRRIEGRLLSASTDPAACLARGANLIGTFAAAWDNSGLHEETFWLGWTTVTQYGWTPHTPTVEQSVADFIDLFHGRGNPQMVEIFRLLEDGSRWFEAAWESFPSTERKRGYGNSKGKGIGSNREDITLVPPQIPASGTLGREESFSARYHSTLSGLPEEKRRNERLVSLLQLHIGQVERNTYSLEVYLSLAYMQRYLLKTLEVLDRADGMLENVKQAAENGDHQRAVDLMVQADRDVADLQAWGGWMWENFVRVWEKSRFPKNRSVGGREFLFVGDDVKDYFADRRLGLEYQLAPFERMDLPAWRSSLQQITRDYALANGIDLERLLEDEGED